jgi:hypothetical protein
MSNNYLRDFMKKIALVSAAVLMMGSDRHRPKQTPSRRCGRDRTRCIKSS